jgi:2,4-dienoyl-CoA reductase-like NADH-dependent reductase (Old Yellow Enzyme family)/thioredoxin reductase
MLDSLFDPVSIGSLDLPNRVVMPPMVTRYASEDGYVTDRSREYFRERARGGTGLIVFECTYPCERHPQRHWLIDDSYVDGLSSVVDAVHADGGTLAVQLNTHRATSDEVEPLAPSPIELPDGGTAEAISRERMDELVTQFAAGADRAKRAGFDAIEIHAASGYLVQQFLSPRTNRRDDAYGGDLEGRTRFARVLLDAVRDEVGEDFPVWFRMPGHEFLEGGIDPTEATRIGRRLADAGSDALHVTAGHVWNNGHIVINGHDERAVYADYAAAVREAVDVPVIAAGRINDPELADDLIADGKADLTAMGRAHIADPHFARKAEAGDLDGIRRCVGGMEGCRDLVNGNPVTCTVNPRVGREGEATDPAADPETIAVVGGGPAGLEFARWAAWRGHAVTVYEAESEIGGQLRWAQNAPGKREYAELLGFLEAELDRKNVAIRTETDIEAEDLEALSADTVVVATGSAPAVPTVEGLSAAIAAGRVVTPEDVLSGGADVETALVYGDSEIGVDVAEYLADRDAAVTIVSPGRLLPERYTEGEGVTSRDRILASLGEHDRDVETLEHASLQAVEDTTAHVVDADGDERRLAFDQVVLAGERRPRSLDVDDAIVIGDAETPSDLYTAIHEGARLGRSI